MGKLINYQYLRTEVDISQNVPDQELDNPIKRSQEMLGMIIGADFLAELETQNPNFSTANTNLMVFIKPFLAWQAFQFWLPKANFKLTAAGARVLQESNSVSATASDMSGLIRDAKMWSDTKKEQVITFLDQNADIYPLWVVNCNTRKSSGGFHITAIGSHPHGCSCKKCHGH